MNPTPSPSAADDAVATGTTETTAASGEELFGNEEQVATTTETSTTETPKETATELAPTSLTRDDITEILKNAGLNQPATQPQTQQQAAGDQPQLTQEQFDQMFNVWKPSEQLIAQLRSEDPKAALQAITQMRDAMIKQALTMAEYRIQQHLDATKKDFDTRLEPLSSYVTEQQASNFRSEFFEKNPDLEKYEQIVDAVAIKLDQTLQGKQHSRDDLMKLYAAETKKVLGPLLQAGQPNNGGSNKVASTGRKMSTLTSGGQSTGNSRGGGAADKKGPAGIEVFD